MDFDKRDGYWRLGRESGFAAGLLMLSTVVFLIWTFTGRIPQDFPYALFIPTVLPVYALLKIYWWLHAKP